VKAYAALLRAVNVGGTGKLPMAELRALCEQLGFVDVATYIQSGNVVFRTRFGAARVKKDLERALADKLGKPATVLLRTQAELADTLQALPFEDAPSNRVLVFFFDRSVPKKLVDAVVPPGKEQLVAAGRELFVFFPEGMGKSKLKLPMQKEGTGRNLNTVRKLAAMLDALSS
jgi:uncharacterized protein (DUF1697 family)